MARIKFFVTGEQDLSIDRQMWEIKRQIRQKGGSPIDPELVKITLQNISEGNFYKEEEIIKKETQIVNFVVGEVFQHRVGLVRQLFRSNFENWLWLRSQNKRFTVNNLGKYKLKDYILPESINDFIIKDNTGSKPMTEDQFWVVLFLLIIKPKLGKKILNYELQKEKDYIVHVELAPEKFIAVTINWNDDLCGEWIFAAGTFHRVLHWYYGGHVFLYLS